MFKQNKGEWSELYVFLKLLGCGILYAADEDLNRIDDLYYPLIEVLRKEDSKIKHYTKRETQIIVIDNDNNNLLTMPMSNFAHMAETLLNVIKTSSGTFSVPDVEDFMRVIDCTKGRFFG